MVPPALSQLPAKPAPWPDTYAAAAKAGADAAAAGEDVTDGGGDAAGGGGAVSSAAGLAGLGWVQGFRDWDSLWGTPLIISLAFLGCCRRRRTYTLRCRKY